MKKIRVGLVISVLLILFVAACGVAETDTTTENTETVTEVTQTPETPELTVTATPTPTPLPLVELTYDFNDLYCFKSHDTAELIEEDGSVRLWFGKQYGQSTFFLPQPIDLSECVYVTVNAKSGDGEISMKLQDERARESIWTPAVAAKFDIKGEEKQEYKCYVLPGSTAYAVSFSAEDDPKVLENFRATIYDVTFHMKPGYELPEKEVAAEENETTLRNTYGTVFEYVGTEATSEDLLSEKDFNFIKKHFNTIHIGHESKQSSILANCYKGGPILISVEEAKELGYIIPDSYKETMVPALRYGMMDSVMRKCAENNLAMRFLCLIWHEPAISWFHRVDYATDGDFVSEEVMDARFEFYITNVVTHLCESKYRDILCGMDVMNEYLHINNDETWAEVYGDPTEQPEFVKKIFEWVDEVLRQYGMREQVSLVFNDYHTFNNVPQIINIINYINSDGKVCDGVGMQMHMTTAYPNPITKYWDALTAFIDAGFEIHVAEMDICIAEGHTETDLAQRYYEIMTYLLEAKKAGGNITQLIWFGHEDKTSWLKEYTPLLFSEVDKPKEAYFKVLEAYEDAGFEKE